jgi:hypothetical protein
MGGGVDFADNAGVEGVRDEEVPRGVDCEALRAA